LKFNNTSKVETGNVATPSKSGSFYTTLSHTHTHTYTQTLQKKWLHITKESLLITYTVIQNYVKCVEPS